MVTVKTTIDISDALLERAKRRARQTGTSLRALVEEGLRRVLQAGADQPRYRLPDRSVGHSGRPDPLESLFWQDLRDEISGRR